jgi:S-layer protein
VNSANTFTALDTVDGGDGTDTLNVSFNGAFTTPGGIKISNVENVNISATTNATLDTRGNFSGMKNLVVTGVGAVTVSTAADVVANVTNSTPGGAATAFDGGSALTLSVTGSAVAADSITVGAVTPVKGAVTIDLSSGTAAVVGAPITSTGGSVVNTSSTIRNTTTAGTSTPGAIIVNGTTDTTSIKVVQTPAVTVLAAAAAIANVQDATSAVGGIGNAAITIADKNGTSGTIVNTLKSVELANYGNTTIASSALDTLTLSSTGKQAQQVSTLLASGTLTVTDSASVPYTKTLALNLAGGRLGATTLPSYETINVNQTAATRVASIVDGNLKTMNVTGTGQFRLDAIPNSLKTLDVTGAAGFRGDISSTALTGFDGTKTTGNNRIALNAAIQDYKGGTGADTVTVSVSPTKVIDGGAGTSDNFIFAGAGSLLSTLSGPNVQNFETLTAAGTGIIELANLTGSKFTNIVTSNRTAGSIEIDSVTPGTPLTISSSSAATDGTADAGTTIYQTSNFTGAATAVTVTLSGFSPPTNTSAGTIGYVTAGVNLRDATGSVGLGTVNIVSDASVGGGLHTITTLTNPNMSALNITGTGGLVITNLTDNAGSLDITDNHSGSGASKITTLTAANIASLSYAGSASYAIDTLAGNVVPTLTISNSNTSPTSGQLTIGALTNATATKVFLNGAVALTGTFNNAALTRIVGGSDDSAVSITATGAGGKTITLGNGANTIVSGAGSDTITTGLGASKVTGAAGGDTINFGAGHSGVASVIYSATGETSTGAVTSGSTVVSAAAGYDIVSGLRAGDTIDLQALTGGLYAGANTAISTSIIAAGANGDIAIVRGNWSAVTGYFATSATGTDSLVQWDSNGTTGAGNIESIILVGFVNTASSSTADGLVTLA